MQLDTEQREALKLLRNLLADAGSDAVRLFAEGQPVDAARMPQELTAALESLGLVKTRGDRIEAGQYRAVSHLGLYLFCEHLEST
jgi:hypothetical protein